MKPVNGNTLRGISKALSRGDVAALEVVDHSLALAEATNGLLKSLITVTSDCARAQARSADERRQVGRRRGILDGIPYVAKDV